MVSLPRRVRTTRVRRVPARVGLMYEQPIEVRNAYEAAGEPGANGGLNLFGSGPDTGGVHNRSGERRHREPVATYDVARIERGRCGVNKDVTRGRSSISLRARNGKVVPTWRDVTDGVQGERRFM